MSLDDKMINNINSLNEVREYNTGSLVTPFSGTTSHYTDSINGVILKIVYDEEDLSGISGSIIFQVSGTEEQILIYASAVSYGDDQISYPFVYGVDSSNTTGSPQVKLFKIVNSPIEIFSTDGISSNGVINNIKIIYR